MRPTKKPLVLSYAGCGTCKKALRWFSDHDIDVEVRPIVSSPPTLRELAEWVPKSGVTIRKWLNSSGQSYRAIGKEVIAGSSDEAIARLLAQDGKLVKRPVVVVPERVLIGFDEAAYKEMFER